MTTTLEEARLRIAGAQEDRGAALDSLRQSQERLVNQNADIQQRLQRGSNLQADALANLRAKQAARRRSPDAGLALLSKFAEDSPAAALGAGYLAFRVDQASQSNAAIADARDALQAARDLRQSQLQEAATERDVAILNANARNTVVNAELDIAQSDLSASQAVENREDQQREARALAAENRAFTREQTAQNQAFELNQNQVRNAYVQAQTTALNAKTEAELKAAEKAQLQADNNANFFINERLQTISKATTGPKIELDDANIAANQIYNTLKTVGASMSKENFERSKDTLVDLLQSDRIQGKIELTGTDPSDVRDTITLIQSLTQDPQQINILTADDLVSDTVSEDPLPLRLR